MGQKPRVLTQEASAADRSGAELRRWRTGRRLSLAQLAPLVLSTVDTLAAMEKATRTGNADIVKQCDDVLEADSVLVRLYADMINEKGREAAHLEDRWLIDSLRLSGSLSEAAPVLREMGNMDIQRRTLLKLVPYSAVALPLVERDWLLALLEQPAKCQAPAGGSHAVAAARTMIAMLDELDNRFGGGYARSTAIHYLSNEMLPQVEGPMPAETRADDPVPVKWSTVCESPMPQNGAGRTDHEWEHDVGTRRSRSSASCVKVSG